MKDLKNNSINCEKFATNVLRGNNVTLHQVEIIMHKCKNSSKVKNRRKRHDITTSIVSMLYLMMSKLITSLLYGAVDGATLNSQIGKWLS